MLTGDWQVRLFLVNSSHVIFLTSTSSLPGSFLSQIIPSLLANVFQQLAIKMWQRRHPDLAVHNASSLKAAPAGLI